MLEHFHHIGGKCSIKTCCQRVCQSQIMYVICNKFVPSNNHNIEAHLHSSPISLPRLPLFYFLFPRLKQPYNYGNPHNCHITKETTLPICSPMAPLHYAHRNHIPFLSTSHNLYWNKYKVKAREGRQQNHSKEKVLAKKWKFLIVIVNQLDNLLKLVPIMNSWIPTPRLLPAPKNKCKRKETPMQNGPQVGNTKNENI